MVMVVDVGDGVGDLMLLWLMVMAFFQPIVLAVMVVVAARWAFQMFVGHKGTSFINIGKKKHSQMPQPN